MMGNTNLGGLKALTVFLPALVFSACTEYTIETTVNADGSGVRVEKLEVGDVPDVKVSREDFPSLMYVGEGERWSYAEVVVDGDTVHGFHRRTLVDDLSSWSRLSDRVRIAGAVPAKARARIGYVTLGNVQFHNAVRVRRAADSDGTTSFTYRETFTWTQGVDAVGEFFMRELEQALTSRYPRLSPGERGEIVGFARARFWAAVEEGLLSGDADEDQLLAEAVDRTAEQAVKIVRLYDPRETEEALVEVLSQALGGGEDQLEALLEDELPGLNLAFNSDIIFRLNMPGRVTDSNAHKRDGTTLIWEFGPAEALQTPIEIYAESVVGG
jgi:hypothetical protein